MIRAIVNAYRRNAVYRQTYKELSKLSDHELCDLGFSRSSLNSIAFEAAYGKEEQHNLDFFKNLFKIKTEKNRIEEYLSDSANVIDLENRLRNIERGLAPWQVRAKIFSQSWAQR